MKAIVGSVAAAVAASACCLGPVVLSAIGAGALGAASTQLEPYRPWFLALTTVLLGTAFVATYRRQPACSDGTCAPSSQRTAKIVLWLAVLLVGLLAAFPYYVNWLI